MDPITRELCGERMHTHDERFHRDKERLDDHEKRIKTTEEAVILLTGLQERQQQSETALHKRVQALEKRPSVWWDRLAGAVVAAVVSAAVAYIL